MILVSACLLGESCKYNGGHNRNQAVIDFLKDQEYLPVCPETLAGLPVPREPSEIRRIAGSTMVVNQEGWDLTPDFAIGAEMTLDYAIKNKVTLAILKENSPSCGVHTIYDGSFTQEKIPGQGIASQYLTHAGIKIVSEHDVEDFINKDQK